jgi:succinate dehydrogenase/fumarate reductase flavoprotein subunit
MRTYCAGKGKALVLSRIKNAVSGTAVNDGTALDFKPFSPSLTGHPGDPRIGSRTDRLPQGDISGAAVGLGAHLSAGVFCGPDDLTGYTGIPGLYVAGDGMNAAAPVGAAYACGGGFTSNFVSMQGHRAGETASKYASGVSLLEIPRDKIAGVAADIRAPESVESGYDPNWARDVLHGVMSPWWVHVAKTEESLTAALTQIGFLRDKVVPKLMARSSHDLRLCHEMKHKVLSAEMKLRAGLFRRESRGFHYRVDFPYRDDHNFLCYITVRKGDNNEMILSKAPVKPEWAGDLSENYTKRYVYYFPGESAAMNLSEGISQS